MGIFQNIIRINHPERFQEDTIPPHLPTKNMNNPPRFPCRYLNVNQRESGWYWTYRKGQYCAYIYGRSQGKLPNGNPEGEGKGVYRQGTSSSGKLHMTPWGPGLSYLFIKSIQLRGRWIDGGWYVSPTIQVRMMDAVWNQTPHQVSIWLW